MGRLETPALAGIREKKGRAEIVPRKGLTPISPRISGLSLLVPLCLWVPPQCSKTVIGYNQCLACTEGESGTGKASTVGGTHNLGLSPRKKSLWVLGS